jgi:hypothetical protein
VHGYFDTFQSVPGLALAEEFPCEFLRFFLELLPSLGLGAGGFGKRLCQLLSENLLLGLGRKFEIRVKRVILWGIRYSHTDYGYKNSLPHGILLIWILQHMRFYSQPINNSMVHLFKASWLLN